MTSVPPPRHAAEPEDSSPGSWSPDSADEHGADPSPDSIDEQTETSPPSRRPVRALLAGLAVAMTLLVGVLVGGLTFLNSAPTLRPPAVDLSPDDVASAKDSVSSAKMMVDLMSSAVNSSTAGIETLVSSIEPTFRSIDTAKRAADQMAAGLAGAPRLESAATRIQELGTSVARGLDEASGLAGSAKSIDTMITPIIDGLDRSNTPGADKTIAQLKSLQSASRDVAATLGGLGPLRTELKAATEATGPAARAIDGAVGQAQTAATQLTEGLAKLSAAKADTEKAAQSMVGGIRQLKFALGTVSNNLASADDSLVSDETQPAYVFDHADRIGRGIVTGAITALGLLVVAAGGVWWRRRRASAAA
ncbi:MAG: hypothetical protein WBA05_14965 [Gordonia sp. (in: high G+C Gram-positive bacteria)]|uniref:hypothetical protein n=1 Tax=Gordonia sp. (in: high G+C Gram-positive bacteria) TaxID=84139 RepID=UPI003C7534D4